MYKPHYLSPSFVTFGCNENCLGCPVTELGEAASNSLSSWQYFDFAAACVLNFRIKHLLSQGKEPLLPSAFPAHKAILEIAKATGTPMGMVTNGKFLPRWIEALHGLTYITFALNSADESIHNQTRAGAKDAHRYVLAALDLAGQSKHIVPYPAVNTTIDASVIEEHGLEHLEQIPGLLQSYNIDLWVMSPFLRFEHSDSERISEATIVLEVINSLANIASRLGLQVKLIDEFKSIQVEEFYQKLLVENLDLKHQAVCRVGSTGVCRIGKEILSPASDPDVAVWDGQQDPAEFLRESFAAKGVQLPERSWWAKTFVSIPLAAAKKNFRQWLQAQSP